MGVPPARDDTGHHDGGSAAADRHRLAVAGAISVGVHLRRRAPAGVQRAQPSGACIVDQPEVVAADATFQTQFTGDLVIVGTKNASATNNKVYGLDAATGTVQWTFNPTGATAVDVVTGWPQVVYETNRVIVTTKSNGGTQASLWVLSTITGSLVQSWSYGDITMGLGGATNGTLYVGTTSGKLYEFDPVTLAMAWSGPYDTGTNNAIV